MNLIESNADNHLIDSMFDIHGEFVHNILSNNNLITDFISRKDQQQILISLLKSIWEDSLYEILEENIIASDGYSIRISPEIASSINRDEVDCYATIGKSPNNSMFNLISIWYNTDTEVTGDSFGQQINDNVKKIQSNLFKFEATDEPYSSGHSNWEKKLLVIISKLSGTDIIYENWHIFFIILILDYFKIRITKVTTSKKNTLIFNVKKITNLPLTVVQFFDKYNMNIKLIKNTLEIVRKS